MDSSPSRAARISQAHPSLAVIMQRRSTFFDDDASIASAPHIDPQYYSGLEVRRGGGG
jgi:hypothetical protein